MEFFPGFNTLQLSEEVKRLRLRLDETPENFTESIILTSMFIDISCGSKDNVKECLARARVVSLYAKRFGKGQWSFLGLGSEKKWYCICEDSPQGEWDKMAEKMMLEFAESGCPIFRAMSPLSRGRLKSKGHGKLSKHHAAVLVTIESIFSHNRLCKSEEYENFHERTERPVVMEQSSSSHVPSVIKTEVLLDCDDPAFKYLLLQQYEERIERLSPESKVSNFCMDAGFLKCC